MGPVFILKTKLSELTFKCDYWPILVAKEVFGILTKCWVRSIFYHPSWDYNVNVPKIPRPSIIWKSRLLKYHSEQKNYIYLNYYRKVFDWPSFVGKKICSILLCLAYCPRSSLGPWASSKTATSFWKSLSSRSKSFHLSVWLCPSLSVHCIMLLNQGLATDTLDYRLQTTNILVKTPTHLWQAVSYIKSKYIQSLVIIF